MSIDGDEHTLTVIQGGMPGTPEWENAVLDKSVGKRKRAIVTAYVDLIIRCREDGSRSRIAELNALKEIAATVFTDNDPDGQRKRVLEDLSEIAQRIQARKENSPNARPLPPDYTRTGASPADVEIDAGVSGPGVDA